MTSLLAAGLGVGDDPCRDGTARRIWAAAPAALTLRPRSAAAFGLSGSLARSLLDLGWTPAAVVAVRIWARSPSCCVPVLVLLRRIGLPNAAAAGRLVASTGSIAVGGAQLCYFSAVQYLSVGVALLLEYLAPVLLIGWHWARNGRRPTLPVLAGAGLSISASSWSSTCPTG